MGTGNLNNRLSGTTITDTFFNDIHAAMNTDFVGRNSTGVPTAGENLGTTALPWGSIRGTSLILNGSAVDVTQIISPQNRVISGKKRSTSNQPAFIVPNGGAASLIIDGTPTSLTFDVNGSAVTVTTDITKSSLTTAPASNNTALINNVAASDGEETKLWGEVSNPTPITIDTVGTNITALVGKWAAFKLAGVATEYFLAYVDSATKLTNCFRGYYYGSTSLPINRTGFSNNDVLTLMNIAWIFIENDATTVDVTYNNPVWSFTSPSSSATGDYWYDMGNNLWKRYDGASFQIINRTYVGHAILDTTNCVAARCVDFHANYQELNTVELEVQTTEIVRSRGSEARASVAGSTIRFRNSIPTWNITTDLAISADMYNATEQASTLYYIYLKDDGDTVISDISPYKRPDLYGDYHPHNPWRLVGTALNDSASNIVAAIGMTQLLAFKAQDANATCANTTSGTDPIIFTTLGTFGFDTSGAAYDVTTGFYTVLRPGIFRVSGSLAVSQAGAANYDATAVLEKNNGIGTAWGQFASGNQRWETTITTTKIPHVTSLVRLLAGDQLRLVPVTNAAGTLGSNEPAMFLEAERIRDL